MLQSQTDAGLCGVESEVHHLGIAEPEERAVVIAKTGVFVEVGKLEFVLMPLKLPRDGLVNGFRLGGMNAGILVDAVVVKIQYLPFHTVNILKQFGVQILQNGLRHSSDNHIQTEIVHQLAVHGLADRFLRGEFHTDKVHKRLLAKSP